MLSVARGNSGLGTCLQRRCCREVNTPARKGKGKGKGKGSPKGKGKGKAKGKGK